MLKVGSGALGSNNQKTNILHILVIELKSLPSKIILIEIYIIVRRKVKTVGIK